MEDCVEWKLEVMLGKKRDVCGGGEEAVANLMDHSVLQTLLAG